MKRLFSLLLALCLLPTVSVGAAEDFRIGVSAPTQVYWDEEIALTFSFGSIPAEGLCGVDFEIGFNADMVEVSSVTLSDFPAEGNWCSGGRVSGSLYLLHVFDNYDETAGLPVSIKNGSSATVTVRFKCKAGVSGNAVFSVANFGAVMGTVFTADGPVTVYGLGASNKTVKVLPRLCAEAEGNGWFIKDGVAYLRPGITVGQLSAELTVLDSQGKTKKESSYALKDDTLVLPNGTAGYGYVAMDANGDGLFSTADYLLVRNHICGGITLKGKALVACDMDKDGYVTTVDLVLMEVALVYGRFPY